VGAWPMPRRGRSQGGAAHAPSPAARATVPARMRHSQEHGIPTHMYPARKSGVGLTDGQLLETLRDAHRVDVVALAGFLKLVPAGVVAAFQGRMLNIHPALLPAFGGKGLYGMNVHRAVVRSGARFSGPTVHFVDEAYDTGPILAQVREQTSPLALECLRLTRPPGNRPKTPCPRRGWSRSIPQTPPSRWRPECSRRNTWCTLQPWPRFAGGA